MSGSFLCRPSNASWRASIGLSVMRFLVSPKVAESSRPRIEESRAFRNRDQRFLSALFGKSSLSWIVNGGCQLVIRFSIRVSTSVESIGFKSKSKHWGRCDILRSPQDASGAHLPRIPLFNAAVIFPAFSSEMARLSSRIGRLWGVYACFLYSYSARDFRPAIHRYGL
jgi:hypothetical protein